MLPSFCRDTVTVWRAPVIEERGTTVRDWANAAPHTVAGCSFQPASTAGTWGELRNGAETRATLWLQPGADIEFGDKVEFQGNVYALDGEPLEWRSPSGVVTHLTCNLVDWRG